MAKAKRRRGQTETGARLEWAIGNARYESLAAFGRATGAESNQTVNNWVQRGIPADRAEDAARFLGVTGAWLRAKTDVRFPPGEQPDRDAQIHDRLTLLPRHRELIEALVLELLKVPK